MIHSDAMAQEAGAVVQRSAGAPVRRSTAISVYEVAALARGQTISEILEDYPSLTAGQVAAAIDYAAAHPRADGASPPRSFKRALSEAAEAGIWDVEDSPGPIASHPIP